MQLGLCFSLAVSLPLFSPCITHGFQVPTTTSLASKRHRRTVAVLHAGENDDESTNGASALVSLSDANASKLASAFLNLAENDQYDAVLTGLCAKILDETEDDKAISSLQDPISLLNEMNDRKVAASGRSLMALVDATVKTQDARAMTNTLSLSLRNGGMTQYGALQNDMTAMPPVPTSRVVCPDGTTKTREERLESLPDVPVDDRASEVSAALAASGVVGFCAACNVLGINDITPYTNFLLSVIFGVGIVDNFYGVIRGGLGLVKDKVKVELPEQESLPLGLGSGTLTGTVVRGLTRLISVDTERECECEAAAFFAAYSLGLPCFAFRPNALEAAVLVGESMKTDQQETALSSRLDPLLSDVGIMKMLIWLMAPVAMESSKHAQLIASDPREAAGLLTRLEERAELFDAENNSLGWMEDEQGDLLKWAYAEADYLLRSNKETVTEITERLAGGAATVGDCVAVMENW